MAEATAVRTPVSREIRTIDEVWIPLSDGCRLSARVWLPVDAEERPVPAILEYLPYRKDDVTAIDDSLRHPYFAARGYAAVRVDIRGSGNSDGVLLDEYHSQEQDDALEVLAWIAAQPWCSGEIGMMGISWGGFNSLQVAARRPPELKAIITACSSDDRYADDVHYMGGCVLAYYMLAWASVMLAFNARPPDPLVVGDRWRAIWKERLEANRFLAETWLSHQRHDAYWEHGSVCEDYSAISCAVLIVGGWADAYTNAVFRLLAGLSCPRRAIVGPWSHVWPEQGVPGPAIGFLQEALRWWDKWLKRIETGVMDEPVLRAWMQDAVEPRSLHAVRPGRWIAEASWPSPRIEMRSYAVNLSGLENEPAAVRPLSHRSSQTVGLDAGAWCSYGNPGDLPTDQRRDDALSLAFDSEPLPEDLELLGEPELDLAFSVDRPIAFVVVRLCDIRPDGASALITRGILNLCHREGHASPVPLEPGRRYTITVPLKATAYRLPARHRVRIALSTAYWPWIWPSPEPVTITVLTGETTLRVPVRPRRAEDSTPRFEAPQTAPQLPFEWLEPRAPTLAIHRDVPNGLVRVDMARSFWGARRLPSGLEYWDRDPVAFMIVEEDPLSARVEASRSITIGRDDWRTRVEVKCVMTADTSNFHVSAALDAFERETRIFTAAHSCALPRDHN